MAKNIFNNCILPLVVLFVLSHPIAASNLKMAALEQKIIEISALRVKIIDKIDQGLEMRIFLQRRLNTLRDEIKIEKNRIQINASQIPLENLRINYNLSLIQQFQAYINQLDERIAYFRSGHEHLKFYLRQIKDDIAIINTLKDMQIENLINRIDSVLDEFIPETQMKIFDAFDIPFRPIEEVWSAIITTPS